MEAEGRSRHAAIYQFLTRSGDRFTTAERLLLWHLIERMPDVYPRQSTIADGLGITRRTVIAALKGLTTKKLVRTRSRGRKQSLRYKVDLDLINRQAVDWGKEQAKKSGENISHQEEDDNDDRRDAVQKMHINGGENISQPTGANNSQRKNVKGKISNFSKGSNGAGSLARRNGHAPSWHAWSSWEPLATLSAKAPVALLDGFLNKKFPSEELEELVARDPRFITWFTVKKLVEGHRYRSVRRSFDEACRIVSEIQGDDDNGWEKHEALALEFNQAFDDQLRASEAEAVA